MVRVSIIIAVSTNDVIGADGGMPWNLPSDLKRFRQLTMGKPIIMGRKTHESIGRVLDGRTNIIVTRQRNYLPPGAIVCANVEDAIAAGHDAVTREGGDEICIIGGGEIYRAALNHVGRIYLTRVHCNVDGDTIFPSLDADIWSEVRSEPGTQNDRDSDDTSFHVFERRELQH